MSDDEYEPDSDGQSTQSLTDDNQKPSDCPTAADTPAKGTIVCDTIGNRKRFNGKHWKQLCRREDCLNQYQKDGLCTRHLAEDNGSQHVVRDSTQCQSQTYSSVEVNDLFDELSEENKRLFNELLFAQKLKTLLNEFKSFLDISSHKMKPNLDSNELQSFEELCRKLTETLAIKEITSEENVESVVNKLLSSKTMTMKDKKREIRYMCPYPGCQYWARVKTLLMDHRKVHHNKANNNPVQASDSMPNSPAISDIDDNKQSTDSTEQNSTPTKKRKKKSQPNNKRKTRICEWEGCGYSTNDLRYFNAHMNVHKGVTPYACAYPGCDKSFANSKYQKIHERSHTEPQSRTFTCKLTDDCRAIFKSRQALRLHQNSKHLGKFFSCDWPGCEYTCSQNQQLQRHIQSAHSETDKLFKCQFKDCRKTFKLEILLKGHMRRHTAERIHQCTHEGCGKAFKTNKELTSHVKGKHSGVRYRCDWPGCEFSTAHKGALVTHRTGVHNPEFNFACHWPGCSKRFKLKQGLVQHLRLHLNEKPYACHWPGCQYRCADSSNFSKHMKNHRFATGVGQQ